MSDATTPTRTRAGDPGRFTSPAPAKRRRSALEAVAAGFALLLLVAGVPALLLGLGAHSPVPSGLPSRQDLTQPVTTELVVTVLVAVVWLAWLFFVVCVAVEVSAALRGGLARPVPLGGPVQKLARVLVGTLLISGVVAGPAGAAPAPDDPAPGPAAVATTGSRAAASAVPDPASDASGHDAGAAHERRTPAARGGEDDGARAATDTGHVEDLAGKKVYTVAAPRNGYHDNLWDIAERHLGDGRRYHEIFRLNQDRVQPDGRTLDLARLIQPGWTLVMPDDAVGVHRVAEQHAASSTAPGTVAAPDGAEAPSDGSPGAGHAPAAEAPGAVVADPDSVTGVNPSGLALGGAGLLAAGVVGSLAAQRRRRPGRTPQADAVEVEVALRVAATSTRAAWLDRALRELAATCLEEGVPLPGIVGAVVDEEAVELLLAPPRTDTCSLWEPLDEGRRWRRDDQTPRRRAGAVAPYPGLVSLGTDDDGRDVLVDLEAAGGVVAVDGDGHLAAEVAAAIAVQAATSTWAREVQVTAAGMPADLDRVGDQRIRVVDAPEAVLPELESRIGRLRTDVLSGRTARRGSMPSYLLVCGASPEPGTAERLAALTGTARQALSVVVAGGMPGARWRMRIDESGVLSVPALGVTVVANRVSAAVLAAVAELFAAADEGSAPDSQGRVDLPAPARQVDDAAWTTAPRRVGVLGPVSVRGAGELEPRRLELATEMTTYLALHPEGVHPTVLAAALWPRGVTAAVRDTAVARVREWLGSGPEGHHHLGEDAEGRLVLSADVVVDWDVVSTLLERSRRALSPREERDLLRRALQLVRGEPLAARPEHRYAWLARTGLERTMRAVVADAARRMATLARSEGDPDAAAAAASAGLRLDPWNQALWRDLLQATHAAAGQAGVQGVLEQMSDRLCDDAGPVELEPETEALLEELLPEVGALPSSG